MSEILAIIPARSGSKTVKHKNIRPLNGKPMLAYSIEHALDSKRINRTIVSTDSEEYADIAKQYGADVPFLRPKEISEDHSLDIEVFQHALNYLSDHEGYIPDVVVQLRPTYPIRDVRDIDAMVDILLTDETADSVRCVAQANEIAYKMWRMDGDNKLTPLLADIPEAYNMPRQKLPTLYYQNACIDVVRTKVITELNSMTGSNIKGYVMRQNFDIDTEQEFLRAEQYLKILAGNQRFVFDIDGVIAQFRGDLDYTKAEPNQQLIKVINKLYDMGNDIVLFTARGYVTKRDWEEVTKTQMAQWGVQYHELIFGKPHADYYIDDKMLDINFLYQIFLW
ncbi:acylneuraminate cytidylyltransferase [Paenibacillus sp. DXFW5]|uniref:N-acylneuraminate cytidylyltransferase n=1 Tax=Paenibacillus rhizolycopersici TaxID=2780073 RepID=A0ABS2HBL1_9BACL|nr:acylneuraminate cytidylyltransferase family protein [Paenibacillus rhizolycopersici]MBM6997260.1 acylneuraminate cytidylyltransferase [Paenibacillus rhizolycopersici]